VGVVGEEAGVAEEVAEEETSSAPSTRQLFDYCRSYSLIMMCLLNVNKFVKTEKFLSYINLLFFTPLFFDTQHKLFQCLIVELGEHGHASLHPVRLVLSRWHVNEAHKVARVTCGREYASVEGKK
jgi:hypothetical protein